MDMAAQSLLSVSAIYVACSNLLMLLMFLLVVSVTFVMATHVYKRAHLSWRLMTCRQDSCRADGSAADQATGVSSRFDPQNVRWLSLSGTPKRLSRQLRARLSNRIKDIKKVMSMQPTVSHTDFMDAQCSTVAESPANMEISETFPHLIHGICSNTCAKAYTSVGGVYTGNYDVASQLCWCKVNDCDSAMAAPCGTRTRVKVYANGLSISSRLAEAELCPSVCMMSHRGKRARSVLTFGNNQEEDAPRTFTHCTCEVDAC